MIVIQLCNKQKESRNKKNEKIHNWAEVPIFPSHFFNELQLLVMSRKVAQKTLMIVVDVAIN